MRLKGGVAFALFEERPFYDGYRGLRVKATVRPEILRALDIAERLAEDHAQDGEIVVTSLLDGKHKAGSLHYLGLAADIRRWNLYDPTAFVEALRKELGPDYDVLLRPTHIHIEYDPHVPALP